MLYANYRKTSRSLASIEDGMSLPKLMEAILDEDYLPNKGIVLNGTEYYEFEKITDDRLLPTADPAGFGVRIYGESETILIFYGDDLNLQIGGNGKLFNIEDQSFDDDIETVELIISGELSLDDIEHFSV